MTSGKPFIRKRLAIVGSGAIGCFYGGRMAAAGADVHFLMRSDYEVVREQGLRVRSVEGDFHLPDVNAYLSTAEIGPCDIVFIALKATSQGALTRLIPPLLQADTMLVTLQNGLGNEEFLAEQFGEERVLGGLCFVCLNRVGPGIIEHYGYGRMAVGEYREEPLPRTLWLVEEMEECGINAELVEDLAVERWRKLVWNVPFNGLTITEGNLTVEDLLADTAGEEKVRQLMREVMATASSLGHALPDTLIDDQISRTKTMGAYKPSSLLDYRAGRPVEVEAIWGETLHRARKAGLSVPYLARLYGDLKRLTGS